jgi:hypothetical protein
MSCPLSALTVPYSSPPPYIPYLLTESSLIHPAFLPFRSFLPIQRHYPAYDSFFYYPPNSFSKVIYTPVPNTICYSQPSCVIPYFTSVVGGSHLSLTGRRLICVRASIFGFRRENKKIPDGTRSLVKETIWDFGCRKK